jgi:predicted Rossmann-fold nucleotide-binding protein
MSTPTTPTTPTPATATAPNVSIDKAVLGSPFIQEKAAKQLRVCCYGSSSSLTPVPYLEAAKSVGYILAKRGHTCVNGAGSFGCMAAMNDGAAEGNGHIVGVIHEMWLTQSEDSARDKDRVTLRDGGAHAVFDTTDANGSGSTGTTSASQKSGGPHPNLQQGDASDGLGGEQREQQGPKREMLVAGGKDLQERKRLLVDKADGLIVLPGGPGTWDEVRTDTDTD